MTSTLKTSNSTLKLEQHSPLSTLATTDPLPMPPQRSIHPLYQTTLPFHWPQQNPCQLIQIHLSYTSLSPLMLSITEPGTFQMSPPSLPVQSSCRTCHHQQASPSLTPSSQMSGAPTLPQLIQQVTCKTLPFHKPCPQHPQPLPTIDLTCESTPLLPPREVIDLRSQNLTPIPTLLPHTTSCSPSYYVRSLTLTTAQSTLVIPETHLQDHHWTPTTLDPDGTILPNPFNTLFILARSPTPPLR